MIEPNAKLECVPKFCYLGDTLGVGGVEKAAKARVRCAWAKFKELSPLLHWSVTNVCITINIILTAYVK